MPGRYIIQTKFQLNIAKLERQTHEDGQDLVEYALVVALIAFAATAGMKTLAGGINTAFVHINTVVGNYTV